MGHLFRTGNQVKARDPSRCRMPLEAATPFPFPGSMIARETVDIVPSTIDAVGPACSDCARSKGLARFVVSLESQLREKLRKIEALFAGAGTAGERSAAGAALDRVEARLKDLGKRDPDVETQFSLADQWSSQLFIALCRRYGLKPYRYPRQRHTSVVVRAPKGFIDTVLWPEFTELNAALQTYLNEVTLRIIREEIHSDTSDAGEAPEALPGS